MNVLSFDSGAERMGWANIETDDSGNVVYLDSGIIRAPRKTMQFQKYRMALTEAYARYTDALIEQCNPTVVVSETIPAVGFNNSTQSYLANVAITVVHTAALRKEILVEQLAAITVKKVVTGNAKATKVAVRNAVIAIFPELESRKKEWVKVFDEPDAIANGLAYLGVKAN